MIDQDLFRRIRLGEDSTLELKSVWEGTTDAGRRPPLHGRTAAMASSCVHPGGQLCG